MYLKYPTTLKNHADSENYTFRSWIAILMEIDLNPETSFPVDPWFSVRIKIWITKKIENNWKGDGIQYSWGRLDPTIKNNCHIGHRKKIEPPAPKCTVSSHPSWSTTGYFGIIMHKRSIKRNTLYKLQRKKEGKRCLQVYAHDILVFPPLNCPIRGVCPPKAGLEPRTIAVMRYSA